ncbi:MAG TPA: O-methyltransferase, partial [Ferruginibacter sp.]|nr:O-methyltransferase [Ferruginibacter sp.]
AERYACEYTSPPGPLLQEILDYTNQHHPHAQMISGPVQGKLLQMISCMIQPLKILEIGTFTGFSALSLLKGLANNGRLHTIELREEDAAIAAAYFKRSGEEERIVLHIGDAREIIPGIKEIWDLVFIDADKVSYIEYYELTLPFLKQGGWLIADNVLFHGEVMDENVKGKNAIAIRAFNDHVANDRRVEQVMLTVRDGLMIARKL